MEGSSGQQFSSSYDALTSPSAQLDLVGDFHDRNPSIIYRIKLQVINLTIVGYFIENKTTLFNIFMACSPPLMKKP
jgi:hypothetical protein